MIYVIVAVGGVAVDVLNNTLLPKIVQISCAEKNFSNKVFFSRGIAVDAVDVDVASHDASQKSSGENGLKLWPNFSRLTLVS